MIEILASIIGIALVLFSVYFISQKVTYRKNGKNNNKTRKEMKQQMILDKDVDDFVSFFSNIRNDMKEHDNLKANAVLKRMDKVMMYTVPDGKKFRGLMTVKCFKNMAKNLIDDNFSMKEAYALGWFQEIIQAGCLIYDDMMDGSITRRGKQCWHLHRNNGVRAINDASFMRTFSFKLITKYCGQHPCYVQLLDVVWSILNYTMFGQILDGLTTPEGKRPDFSLLNESRYETIVKYKTSYYTFVMPVRLAMYLAEITDEEIHADAEKLLLRIGHFFQVQDDYLDIYGDPNVTGKVGTDIADGKCNWIAVQAYKRLQGKQKQWFEDNYGMKQRICVIDMLFDEVNVKNIYKNFEEKEHREIQNMINVFQKKHNLNADTFSDILKLLYKRQK